MTDPILPCEIKGANGSSRVMESLRCAVMDQNLHTVPFLVLFVWCLRSLPKNRPSLGKFESQRAYITSRFIQVAFVVILLWLESCERVASFKRLKKRWIVIGMREERAIRRLMWECAEEESAKNGVSIHSTHNPTINRQALLSKLTFIMILLHIAF